MRGSVGQRMLILFVLSVESIDRRHSGSPRQLREILDDKVERKVRFRSCHYRGFFLADIGTACNLIEESVLNEGIALDLNKRGQGKEKNPWVFPVFR